MLWNPTSNITTDEFPQYDSQTGEFSGGNYLIGGKHFIYILKGDLKLIEFSDLKKLLAATNDG